MITQTAILLCIVSGAISHSSPWHPLGPADPEQKIKFGLMLPQKGADTIKQLVKVVSDPESASYGQYLTPDQIFDIVRPDALISDQIVRYLSQEAPDIVCGDLGDSLYCEGSVKSIEKMFSVTMWNFYNPIYRARAIRSLQDYTIPANLPIEFVNGISNKLIDFKHIPKVNVKSDRIDSRFVAREPMMRLYNMTSGTYNTSVCAVEFQAGGFVQADLDTSATANGLSPWNVSHVSGSDSGEDIETMLDLTMMVDLANGSNLWFMNYGGWILEFAQDQQSRKVRPNVLSLSYGWAEWDQCSVTSCNGSTAAQYIARSNTELAKLALLGQTVVVASGDAGSPGRTNEGCNSQNPINPVYPGSSPYILSVGATAMISDNSTVQWKTSICQNNSCTTGYRTRPVNFADVQWTSGSGFGIYDSETQPDWQSDAVTEYLQSGVALPNSSFWNDKGRGYPDVTANGHNCPVYNVFGLQEFEDIDGTSCSTPIWASIIAILNDYQTKNGRPNLGFVNPLLYKMAKSCPLAFIPVDEPGNSHCTEGTCCSQDFGFQTPPKKTLWNPVTGLGQPNVGVMKECLDSIFG